MDSTDMSSSTNRRGFSYELQKAKKKLTQSKSITFLDQDEVNTFEKVIKNVNKKAKRDEKVSMSPAHCSRLLE